MSYDRCCCEELNSITQAEIKTLWVNSYPACLKSGSSLKKVCAGWSSWFRWLCILWSYIVEWVCLLWTTVTNILWSFAGYYSLFHCLLFGPSAEVWVLNNILKKNLANSIALGFGTNPPLNPAAKSGWTLTFYDEFNTGVSSTVDQSKWYPVPPDLPNPFPDADKYISTGVAPPAYYDASAVILTGSGTAQLVIDQAPKTMGVNSETGPNWGAPVMDPNTALPLTVTIGLKVGNLVAKDGQQLFAQRFGYFETRCKMPASKATWPAFWLWGILDWPPEIDVFEVFTSQSFSIFGSNYHWGAVGKCFGHDSAQADHAVNNISGDFHTYGCEWDSCYIKWYYDNMLVRVAYQNVTNIFEPMRLVINNGVDTQNNATNYTSVLSLPAVLEVDYVRAYKKP